MGFFKRLFGGDSSGEQPPEVPKFAYELMYVPGEEAVRRALALREEWRGSATPVILGTAESFGHVTNLWGEPEVAAVAPQEFIEQAAGVNLEEWFAEHRPEAPDDPEYLEYINKASDWNTKSGSGEDFVVPREILSRKFHPWVLVGKV